MVGRKLCTVGPVDLVAVVLLGIMAGSDVDARLTAVFPHGKAQLRRGPQGFKNADMDAVGSTDLGGGPGDRRKCRLVPTEKAALVIAQGRALQERFSRQLVRGLTAEDAAHFERCLTVIGDNMTAMAEDRRKNEGV